MAVLDTLKIKILREKKGLTMDQAAKLAGMKKAQRWNEFENGDNPNVTLETLTRLAKALGCDVRDLIKG